MSTELRETKVAAAPALGDLARPWRLAGPSQGVRGPEGRRLALSPPREASVTRPVDHPAHGPAGNPGARGAEQERSPTERIRVAGPSPFESLCPGLYSPLPRVQAEGQGQCAGQPQVASLARDGHPHPFTHAHTSAPRSAPVYKQRKKTQCDLFSYCCIWGSPTEGYLCDSLA